MTSIILNEIPRKKRDFAINIPYNTDTYVYENESDYYKGYEEARFAITMKKAGFECERHYEILARGAIPYFLDWEQYPETVSAMLPRELLTRARNLLGKFSKYINFSD